MSTGDLNSHTISAIVKEVGKKTFSEYAIDYMNTRAPLVKDLYKNSVGTADLFLCSGLGRCMAGSGFELRGRRSRACGVQQVDGTIAQHNSKQ